MGKRTAVEGDLFRTKIGESRADDEGCTSFSCHSSLAGRTDVPTCCALQSAVSFGIGESEAWCVILRSTV